MNKITEITRRDIQDVITSGFYVKELIDPTVECDVDFPSGKFNIYICLSLVEYQRWTF